MSRTKMPMGFKTLANAVVRCRRCPRLVRHRLKIARIKRAAYRDEDYWGRPVPGFGDLKAWLLIVGLAPAAHGANRTGRMFTGDSSGSFLLGALFRAGLANRPESTGRGDGLRLAGAYMTAVARCAPPENRPLPEELGNCRAFLLREFRLLGRLRAVLALGHIALDGYLDALRMAGHPVGRRAFKHGARYSLGRSAGEALPVLYVSYHPSRQNTQTGRLRPVQLDRLLATIRKREGKASR